MDKFSSRVHKVRMELGGKLLNSLRIKTQFLARLQSVSVVDGAAHTQTAAEVLQISLNCPLPLRGIHPPPYISLLFLCFCSDGSNQHKIWVAGGKYVFIWEAGWEEPFGNNSTFSCFRNLEILHGHPFVAAYIYGDNA